MRILQVHTRYRIRAGEDSVVDNEAAVLRDAGDEVVQFTVDNPTDAAGSITALARSPHNRAMAAAVRDEIRRCSPDVVHIHNTWFAMSSSVVGAAASTGVPVVMTLHNYRLGCLSADLFRDGAVCTACVGRSPARGVVHGCYRGSRALSAIHAAEVVVTRRRRVLDRAVRRFVIPSDFMADRLVEIGVPTDRIVVKPHFAADVGERPAPPSTSGEVLCIGRLAPGKGVETLLSAWPDVTSRGVERLTIIGDGPLAGDLAASLPPGAEIVGWRERAEVQRRLASARALIMPTEWYEPFGMVLIEAMSAGLPIVTTTAAGARSIVGGRDDLVVPPHQPADLAAAIDRLDDETVDREGAANRARYEDRYTEQRGLADLRLLYEGVTR
ncbi:MAG: glycosyltransferase family 4 protein [Ilumatobacteraceae bacterium]